MRISVVTISFNQAAYLEECIRSVINQDHKDVEYIVVDPGSSDESRQIIGRYQRHITHVIFAPDDGPADGLNKGFSQATGDIFCYINADDFLLPGALSTANDFFTKNPDVDVVLGHGYRVNQQGRPIYPIYSSRQFTLKKYAIGTAIAVQQATFFRASTYRACGGFNINNRTCWDGELLISMLRTGARIKCTNEYFGAFRVYPESITGSGALNAVYVKDVRRITEEILGRELNVLDHSRYMLTRVFRLIMSPRQTLARATAFVKHRYAKFMTPEQHPGV